MGGGAGICQHATPGPTYAPIRDVEATGRRGVCPVSLHPARHPGRCTGRYGARRMMAATRDGRHMPPLGVRMPAAVNAVAIAAKDAPDNPLHDWGIIPQKPTPNQTETR